MSKPLVAVVGRPNVGKSTFFNRIIGQRMAIVENTPGVTRDRLYADAEWLSRPFTLIDTGGIDPDSVDILLANMRKQPQIAFDMADDIVFMVDAKEGITPGDEDVADMLRRSGKPILLAVNKVDKFPADELILDFYSLGIGQPIPISAAQALGLGDMLDELVALFPDGPEEDDDEETVKIAVVGRPNVGKSSLVNALVQEERVIVSDIPGTTRDAIDTPLFTEEGRFILIDTAGMRKKGRIEDESLERYSVVRSLGAIRRCDVALIMIDAQQGVTEQDAHIAGFVQDQGKAAVIVVNKWDLMEKGTGTLEHMQRKVLNDLVFMDYAPVVFISAKTGQRVHRILSLVKEVFANACGRVSTGVHNDVISDAMLTNEPPIQHGHRLKVLYATQASVRPPTFVLFVNDTEAMYSSYQRYLENYLRKTFTLTGTPVRFILRARNDK